MTPSRGSNKAVLGRAILAVVAGLARPVSLSEMIEMLETQGFHKKDVQVLTLSMLITGKLKHTAGLKIILGQALPEGVIRQDVAWAVAELGRANRQIEVAKTRRKEAIASLITMSGRDFQS